VAVVPDLRAYRDTSRAWLQLAPSDSSLDVLTVYSRPSSTCTRLSRRWLLWSHVLARRTYNTNCSAQTLDWSDTDIHVITVRPISNIAIKPIKRKRQYKHFGPENGSPMATNVVLVVVLLIVVVHIFVCFMAKSAFWRGFSALAPYTGVGPI